MASTIKIKRSTTTATPTSLQNAELAYTSNGEVLFIGSVVGSNTANVVAIAGRRYPGTLTANQAIVTNTSNWIDSLQTAKLIIGAAGTTDNVQSFSTFSNSTQLGASASGSNTEIVSSWAIKNYVNLLSSSLPNTYVAFGVNSLANGGVATFTFDSTTNKLSIGNSTVNSTVSQTAITTSTITVSNTIGTGNVTVTGFINVSSYGTFGGTVNTTALNVGANVNLSTTNINVGNSTINTAITSSGIDTDGTLAVAGLATFANIASGNTTVTGFINVSSYGTFGGTVNATAINVGANVNLTTTSISVGNSSVNTRIEAGNLFLNGTTLVIGNTVTNTTITGTSFSTGGLATVSNNLVVTGTANVGSSLNVGANVNLTTTSFNVGNSSVNTSITSTAIDTDGTLAVAGLSTLANVSSGNTTVTGFINVSSYGTFGGTVNTGIHNVAGNVQPTISVTHSLGTPSLLWQNVYSNTVISNYGVINNDLTVSGNLTVSGSLVSVNVATLTIVDPLIQLASNNSSTDTLDVGFYATYGSTGAKYTGLFRDATDSIYKLFSGLTVAPTTTVDTSNASYSIATLQSYLNSGALVSNSSTVTVTANSTINVNFTANSIVLTTPLALTSGGTGYNTIASGDLLVGNASNVFTKLNIGADGKVLQVSGTSLVYGDLDGGTF